MICFILGELWWFVFSRDGSVSSQLLCVWWGGGHLFVALDLQDLCCCPWFTADVHRDCSPFFVVSLARGLPISLIFLGKQLLFSLTSLFLHCSFIDSFSFLLWVYFALLFLASSCGNLYD